MPVRVARLLFAVCACLLTTATSAAELGKIHLNEYLGATFVPQTLHYRLEIPRGRIKDTTRCGLRDTSNQPILAQFMSMDTWEDGSIHHLEVSFVSGLHVDRLSRSNRGTGRSPTNERLLDAARH